MKTFFEQLPAERPVKEPIRVSVFQALSTLLLVVLFNLVIREYQNEYSINAGLKVVNNKWELLLSNERPVDVLVLGDSTANQAIVAERFDALEGLYALNVATLANMTMVGDIWMLRVYIEQHGPPEQVIIMHTYQMWHRSPAKNTMYSFPYFSVPNRSENLKRPLNISAVDQVDALAYYYFPAFSENGSLQTQIRTAFEPRPEPAYHIQISEQGGWQIFVNEPDEVLIDIEKHLWMVSEQEGIVSAVNIAALQELVELANRYEVEIYLMNGPIAEAIATDEAFLDYFSSISAVLTEVAAQSPFIYYDNTIYYDEFDNMQSADHLLADAALAFTDALIAALYNK